MYRISKLTEIVECTPEVVLLLPTADLLQQVYDYVRGCNTSTKY